MEGFTNDRRDLYTLTDILYASARSILPKLFINGGHRLLTLLSL